MNTGAQVAPQRTWTTRRRRRRRKLMKAKKRTGRTTTRKMTEETKTRGCTCVEYHILSP